MPNSDGEAMDLSSSPETFEWRPLVASKGKLEELWAKVQELPEIVSNEPQFSDASSFFRSISHQRSVFYEVGDCVGMVSLLDVRPKLDALLKFVFFDRKLRGKELVVRDILDNAAHIFKLHRVTAIEPSKRETTCNFIMRCGFLLEGVMRHAYLDDGEYSDLAVFGLVWG